MFTFIIILIIITCILLALVVLVQNSKGGGLAAGLAASTQVMGVRKTTDFFEKLTWGLAITLVFLSIVANFAIPRGEASRGGSSIQEQIDNAAAPAAPAPNQNQGQQQPTQNPGQGQ